MSVIASVLAVAIAWVAGLAVVLSVWPRDERLPVLDALGLSGLIGTAAIGAALLVAAPLHLPVPWRLAAVALVTTAAVLSAWRVRATRVVGRRAPAPDDARTAGSHSPLLVVVLLAAVSATSLVAARTTLGWDGTVVWYHKARAIAEAGTLPATTLADRTRSWTAPDYPLHVPAAMAWVRLWQPVEDERALKVLPAAWAVAIWCLVAAAVRERSRGVPDAAWRPACAVLLLASTPRLLVGEGSVTSGYADGPAGGLLAALVWIAWRSRWGEHRQWHMLLAVIAATLAWTKQEGTLAVAIAAVACAWRQREWTAGLFAAPALVLTATWQAWVTSVGAPTTMAYAWPGTSTALGRLPLIARAYVGEALLVRTWGLLWVGLIALQVQAWRTDARIGQMVVICGAMAGALVFCLSTWPEVAMHLQVTVPRQYIQIAPALALLGCSAVSSR